MSTPSMDVRYVAQLARLNLSPDEAERFQAQLEQVLAYVEQLEQLDVKGIEPTAHAVPRSNVFRADEESSSLPVDEALGNAPQRLNNLFRVPKVVE
ncbi:MAG: Asp-tRNA(Asn)/Glu-tRNA(Gln) amidotransferase subunit GatC [Verrucomicrobiae bacterium]|nr:Asp-tRNA(Asn)/Glu-tRNA(Gln) amidotransferase subunit GatC [Verrucomicrobiae bacterium]